MASSSEYSSGFSPTLVFIYLLIAIVKVIVSIPIIVIQRLILILSNKNDAIIPVVALSTLPKKCFAVNMCSESPVTELSIRKGEEDGSAQ